MAIFAKWADVGFPTNIDTICNGLSHNHWTMFATLCAKCSIRLVVPRKSDVEHANESPFRYVTNVAN